VRAVWPAFAVTSIVLAFGAASGAGSDGISAAQGEVTIPAGFDLFETDPEQTVFRFQGQTSIPANFFDQGSQPFQGDVNFGGVPLGGFQGKATGDADTVVQRKSGTTAGTGSEVPIELVQLSLVSVAPIQVQVGQGTQLWDVHAQASPSRPSTGDMRINSTGLFESLLKVYPKFTFTRLSDGALKVLDVGALPDGQRPEITLAGSGPWRPGCVPPALRIAGVNDKFCPGQKSPRDLVLIQEQAPQATHAVRPVQPMLEHFRCWSGSLAEGVKFTERDAKLIDQFGESGVQVKRPELLCNPAQKNKEPFANKKAHLFCYTIVGKVPDGPPTVQLRDQFGSFKAEVRTADRLCVPSTKQLAGEKKPKGVVFTDHFQCYSIKVEGDFKQNTVGLKDQFGSTKNVPISKPFRLCAPTQKNGEKSVHPVQHLVCYKIQGAPLQKVTTIRNQYGRLKFIAKRPRVLCVPAIKRRL
jgi:hypothetical protein